MSDLAWTPVTEKTEYNSGSTLTAPPLTDEKIAAFKQRLSSPPITGCADQELFECLQTGEMQKMHKPKKKSI